LAHIYEAPKRKNPVKGKLWHRKLHILKIMVGCRSYFVQVYLDCFQIIEKQTLEDFREFLPKVLYEYSPRSIHPRFRGWIHTVNNKLEEAISRLWSKEANTGEPEL